MNKISMFKTPSLFFTFGFFAITVGSSIAQCGGFDSIIKSLANGAKTEEAFLANENRLRTQYEQRPGQMTYSVKTNNAFGSKTLASLETSAKGYSVEFNLLSKDKIYAADLNASEGYKIVNVKTMDGVQLPKSGSTTIDQRQISFDEGIPSTKPGATSLKDYSEMQTKTKDITIVKGADGKPELLVNKASVKKGSITKTIERANVLDKKGVASEGITLTMDDLGRPTTSLASFKELFGENIPKIREVGMDTAKADEFYVVSQDANGAVSKTSFKAMGKDQNKTWVPFAKVDLGKQYQAVRTPSEPQSLKAGDSVFGTKPATIVKPAGVTN